MNETKVGLLAQSYHQEYLALLSDGRIAEALVVAKEGMQFVSEWICAVETRISELQRFRRSANAQ